MATEGAVGGVFFTEQKRGNSNLLRVLNLLLCALDHGYNRKPTSSTNSVQGQTVIGVLLLAATRRMPWPLYQQYLLWLYLYVARGTDQWFFIQVGKCLPPCHKHTPCTSIQLPLGSDSVSSALESNGCVSLCREGGPERQAGVEHLGHATKICEINYISEKRNFNHNVSLLIMR